MQAAKAALMACDIEPPKTHGGLRREFSLRFVRDGPLPRHIGRSLTHTEQLRSRSDYAPPSSRTMADARLSVQHAHTFAVRVVGEFFPELANEVPRSPLDKEGTAPDAP